jgi:flavin reductase (DIM6/NTAB) family NADH-FMN oxidoreductase RutF
VAEGGTGEFVVNMATENLAREMVATAEALAFGTSEFEMAGVTPTACKRVAAPRVAEAPVSFECETLQVVRLAPGLPVSGNILIGKVVYVWVDDRIIDERLRISAAGYPVIGRMGGNTYCRTRDIFNVERGKGALDTPLPFEPAALGVESE